MSLKYAIGAALATGVLATAPVSAADTLSSSERAQIDQAFTRLDTNNDGGIDKAEAQKRPRLEQNFSQYDTDHSGKLGKDEFAAAVSALRTARGGAPNAADSRAAADQRFTRLDRNDDGNIDQAEVQAHPWLQKNFSKYDTDHNGKLGKDEFAAAVNAERLARSDTRSAATGGTQPAGRSFESLDRNNDGNIDTTEAQGWRWLQRNFSQYDSDRNGKLGKDEFAAASNAAARR